MKRTWFVLKEEGLIKHVSNYSLERMSCSWKALPMLLLLLLLATLISSLPVFEQHNDDGLSHREKRQFFGNSYSDRNGGYGGYGGYSNNGSFGYR